MSIVNKKMMKTEEAANEEDPIVFKILEGTMILSDYATFHLLVPEDSIEDLAEALRKSKSSLFVWTVGDEEITDIQNIPTTLVHPIRSLGKIPQNKSESELLDWLIHGESFFSKRYLIMKCIDGKDGDDGYNGEYAYEIRNKEHEEKLVDAVQVIFEVSERCYGSDLIRLGDYYIIDRGEYLRRFDHYRIVDDGMVKNLEEISKEISKMGDEYLVHVAFHEFFHNSGSY